MRVWAPQSSYAAKRDGVWEAILDEIAGLGSLCDLGAYRNTFTLTRLRDLPVAFHGPFADALELRRDELVALAKARSLDAAFARAMERD